VLHSALSGFYFNSWRVVVANVIWGVMLIVTLGIAISSPILGLIALLVVLPIPTAALFRVAAMIVRDEHAAVVDAFAWRTVAKRGIGAGLIVGGASVVLLFNLVTGVSSADPVSVGFGTAAFWGLFVLWLLAASVWPLLFDPLRATEPVTSVLRLALVVVLVKPLRFIALMFVLFVILVISAILAAALLTISMGFAALVLAYYAIHSADRIEGRRTIVVIN
jgi:uncharacterized membrane protein YesL